MSRQVNQYTADDTFITSNQGTFITELRKFGDNICLYTENPEIFRRFSASKFCVGISTYQRANADIYAHDLYFPKAQKNRLITALKKALKRQPTVAEKRAFFT